MENAMPGRMATLDALRGFAVMGILAMNIVGFAMPEFAYISPVIHRADAPGNFAAWAVGMLLFDGKMRGLFSILFGASMLLIIDRAAATGENPARVHYSRMAWLALFGLAHFFFIWFGDILFLYASVGCVAFLFRNKQPRSLVKWALTLFAVGTLLTSALFGVQLFAARSVDNPSAPPALVEAGKKVREGVAKIGAEAAQEVKLYRQGFGAIAAHKWKEKRFQPLIAVVFTILETLPLMLLGMALFRTGFLTGAWDNAAYRRMAWRTIPIGGALTIAIMAAQANAGFENLFVLNAFIAWSTIPRLLMTIGYAAVLILLIKSMAGSSLLARVSATGRAAFSNYLGTSLLMTFTFYGWGLGLFGSVDRAALYLFVVGAWAIMLLWSKPWLDRFNYGPMEWLWRSLARRKLQPMRKAVLRPHAATPA